MLCRSFSGRSVQDSLGTTLKIKRAKTALLRERNNKLHLAKDLISKHPAATQVTIDFPNRQIKNGGVVAFSQDKSAATGQFVAPFDTLHF